MIVRENVDPEYVIARCEKVYFENTSFSPASIGNSVTPYAFTRMEFANVNPSVYVISSDNYVVKVGYTTSLSINTCVWAPEHYEIEIGFWNIDTGTTYTQRFTGGSLSKTLFFSNMPAGTYRLFVVNNGATKLTTGYMLYNVN